jgi:WD40 repeat protein
VCFASGNEVVVVTDNSVGRWKWESGSVPDAVINAQVLCKNSSPDLTQRNEKAIRTSTVERSVTMDNIKFEEFGHSTCAGYTCATLSQDGQFIIVGASNCTISIWNIEKGRLVKEYQNHNG